VLVNKSRSVDVSIPEDQRHFSLISTNELMAGPDGHDLPKGSRAGPTR
jgi:hypothetical protein